MNVCSKNLMLEGQAADTALLVSLQRGRCQVYPKLHDSSRCNTNSCTIKPACVCHARICACFRISKYIFL
jgi:hypothetical protein